MQAVHPVCLLAEGRLLEWIGLEPFPFRLPPPCLEPTGAEGWLRFHHEPLAYRIFRLAEFPSTVWLFAPGEGDVCLVEVFGITGARETDGLGEPDLRFAYPLEGRMQRPLGNADENPQEWVYADRGLALLVDFPGQPIERLVRARGFQPMPTATYRDRFVDLPRMRWF